MNVRQGIVGEELELHVQIGAVTGLTYSTLTSKVFAEGGVALDDPLTDLEVSFGEVDAVLLPGVYYLRLTPRAVGSLFIRLISGATTVDEVIQCSQATVPFITDPSFEGELTLTVDNGSGAVSGAVARVFDSTGSTLVARGTTDIDGEVTFTLPAGNYQVRYYKEGIDFDDVNPQSVIVMPNDNVTPRIDEILPTTGSIADVLVLVGQYFHLSSSQVLFGSTVASATHVSSDGKVLRVVVPAGLTATVIAVRVRKPDPDNEGSYLLSNVINFVRT